ncbi:MAG: TetR/AcrR family transcriptional regulator [Alphaproteobacteria bacterium]|nr:TetR/AcrR family transcriptional regulator [Alphaproteobacteria bacterium]MBF0391865.1 TetR/AcrR family transcriptional regulator [Alphaproteobacteria bacterium]
MASGLDKIARRNAIIDAALPLFAQKGFAATTTKEIAAAATVSEALIFKHFDSKAALYEAILSRCLEDEPELKRLLALPPSTDTLIQFVRSIVRHFAIDVPAGPDDLMMRHRLMIRSFLEDGEYARLVYRWVAEHIAPAFEASLREAIQAGDAVQTSLLPGNALWLVEHLASMLATVQMPPNPIAPHASSGPALADQATLFILRGLGLTVAIAAPK